MKAATLLYSTPSIIILRLLIFICFAAISTDQHKERRDPLALKSDSWKSTHRQNTTPTLLLLREEARSKESHSPIVPFFSAPISSTHLFPDILTMSTRGPASNHTLVNVYVVKEKCVQVQPSKLIYNKVKRETERGKKSKREREREREREIKIIGNGHI